MASQSRQERHEKAHTRSYKNLIEARRIAGHKFRYNTAHTRHTLEEVFLHRFGHAPYGWQLDVAEAILLGLDTVLIAGTGSGKTIPFMMPLLLEENKLEIIISPLKVLQKDQASRFKKMNIPAVAVNGDTWGPKLKKRLEAHKYQAILTSPEMCIEHPEFRKWLTSKETTDNILSVIVDEAHCISQWGGDFRPPYALLNKLRAFLPPSVPVLAASATLAPSALDDVCSNLLIDLPRSFFLNLGNDRPNITFSVEKIKSKKDYTIFDKLLPKEASSPDDFEKTIIFTNSVNETQTLCRHLRKKYPPHLHQYIDFLHAHRTPRAKKRVMKRFRKGEVKILIATEAAGMGADIPDIRLVIQLGVPSSLAVWIQRAGRAGRSPNIQARAILLVEESMFSRKKKKKPAGKKPKSKKADTDTDSESSDSGSDSEADVVDAEDDGKEWVKKVEEALRRYIETIFCRRDMVDNYFDNPPRRIAPTGMCCDQCLAQTLHTESAKFDDNADQVERPHTPTSSTGSPSSTHSTPSKTENANGKRIMTQSRSGNGNGPATRRGKHLQSVRAALENWRYKTKMHQYSPGPFTAVAILPDKTITTLASNARIKTIEDMYTTLKPKWVFTERHGHEVLEMIKKLDEDEKEQREHAKNTRRAAKRRETEARREEARIYKTKRAGACQAGAGETQALVGSSVFNVVPVHQALGLSDSQVPQMLPRPTPYYPFPAQWMHYTAVPSYHPASGPYIPYPSHGEPSNARQTSRP